MIGWHHPFNGHEFEKTLGASEGQRSLACCSLWGCKVGHNLETVQQQHTTSPESEFHCKIAFLRSLFYEQLVQSRSLLHSSKN